MKCCIECFANDVVREFIESKGMKGICAFCETNPATVIEPTALRPLFAPLLRLYELDVDFYEREAHEASERSFRTLFELIQEGDGLQVFSNLLEPDTGNRLLDAVRYGTAIPTSGEVQDEADAAWRRSELNPIGFPSEFEWDAFARYIKHRRRYILEAGHFELSGRPDDWLPKAIIASEAKIEVAPGEIYFRARKGSQLKTFPLHDEKWPLPVDEMGAPRENLTTSGGRANPPGIAYLYVCKEEDTAVAEVRPGIGEDVSIRMIRSKQALRLVDLQKPFKMPAPIGNTNLQDDLRRHLLLSHLNIALSSPVRRTDSEIEYVPTQYLAEVIAHSGYDGICFRSAMRKQGTNIVLFDPGKLEVLEAGGKVVTIDSIEFGYL
jgi:hypothetical protein